MFALFYLLINARISHVIITLIHYFLIPKSRDLVSHNPGISGLKNGPGSRDPGIRDPGIAIPKWHSGWHHRSADAEASGCPEHRRPPDCRRQKVRSRQPYTVRSTLVASQKTHHLQAVRSGLQVPPRHGPTIPV